MKILLQLNKKIINFKHLKNFSQLKLTDKILIMRVFILTAVMRSAILIIPFKHLRKYMGKLNKESPFNLRDNEYKAAKRISWSINKVSKYTPWESKCFVQALTAQYLLSKAHIESTLYLGISIENKIVIEDQDIKDIKEKRKSNLVAHSWIRCGSYYVTGGEGDGFVIVTKFAK